MDPIITPIVIAVVAAGFLISAWPYISHFIQVSILPWLRSRLNAQFCEAITEFFIWIDHAVCALRRPLRDCLQVFKKRILGIRTTFTKVDQTTVRDQTTTTIVDDNGRMVERTSERVVPWEEIPQEIRSQMMRENATTAKQDTRAAILDKVRSVAAERGEVLELEA
jgi:hypothetical protein